MDLMKVLLLIFLLLTDVAFGFQVYGLVTMGNETETFQVSPGNGVVFTFNLQMELLSRNERLLVSIDGDTLEFSNDTNVDAVNWMITDSRGAHKYTKESTDLDASETLYVPINKPDGSLGYLLNISAGLDLGVWTLTGSFRMVIVDDVTGGSMLRAVLTTTVVWASRDTSTDTTESNYYMVPIPEVKAEAMTPLTQPILGIFVAQVTIQSSRDVGSCFVHVYTFPENTSKEVRLTVQKLWVVPNETLGTTSDTMAILENVVGTKISSLGSYQNNMAVMALPRIPLDTANFSEVTVTSEFKVRVEDYSELESGDKWPVEMGVSFSGNVIWVGDIDVNISAPSVRLPVLFVDVQQLKECAYNGNSTAVLQVLVRHSSESTGTAYNVTVNVYLPDYMRMTSNVFTIPLENTITVRQDRNVVVAEIARLTFSDPFSLEITLDLDMSSAQILTASNRIVTVEAVSGDRWGNLTEILSDTAYLSLDVSGVCSKRLTWTTSTNCPCSPDSSMTKCACCVPGACQCGASRPHACAPCSETQWRCKTYKEGFEKIMYLPKSDVTEAIRCDSFHMRRGSATGVSCHKTLPTSPPKYLELSPRVAVVTGINSITGILFGISNNGLAYVISQDGGATWTSIRDDVYKNMTSNQQIRWANST